MEDTVAVFSKGMVFSQEPSQRFYNDSAFIKNLVSALKIPHSFYYPFDSVKTVSKIYPADSSFRIFTWEIEMNESYFRQYGAIQMNTGDGSLQLFPLQDMSEFALNPTDSVRSNLNWIGAIYYNIVMKEYKGKKYYTLIGLDDNDFTSTRKWIDVLTFENGKPQFGGKFFEYKDDTLKPAQPVWRFLLEFRKDAKARMIYDKELDLIMFDHLISESNELEKRYTLIPDGDYEAFKWQDGKWVHVEKVFNEKLKEGEAPRPNPLDDNDDIFPK